MCTGVERQVVRPLLLQLPLHAAADVQWRQHCVAPEVVSSACAVEATLQVPLHMGVPDRTKTTKERAMVRLPANKKRASSKKAKEASKEER
mmetsp:Transcript_43766/g.103420  ORF Transcript_43766/g.103420 Transcript_43766/m.103420 type:complete len:91 (-) Transcript_43766:1389-1661(-)